MNRLKKLRFPFVALLALTVFSCTTKTNQENFLSDRIEAAEEAFANSSINKGKLLKILLETDMERGQRAYKKNRLEIAQSSSAERLHDPPRHYRHRERLEMAREANEIGEEEYDELSKLVEIAHGAWMARRKKVMRDRAIWRLPR